MNKINIVDAPCGAGKTSWAIEYMNSNTDTKFIYITPFLEQVERIKDDCYMREFHDPDVRKGKGSKLEHLRILIDRGCNISTTHALFRYIDREIINRIKEQNYVLILDEVMNVLERHEITKQDLEILIDKQLAKIEEDTNRIIWLDENYEGNFENERRLLENGDCYISTRTSKKSKKELLIWTFPCSVFKAFKETYVLTYLFDGQMQAAYYKFNNIQYEYHSVENINDIYQLIDYKQDDRSKFKELINIYDNHRLNRIGLKEGRSNPLSTGWYQRCYTNNSDQFEVLKKHITNYFTNVCHAKHKDSMWTTYKEYKNKITPKGFGKSFIQCTCRATNEHKDRYNLAYCINLFMNPVEKGFFEERNIEVNQDVWALSELIQWIFRSAIRDNKPINIYIPSDRMRELLIQWMDNKI